MKPFVAVVLAVSFCAAAMSANAGDTNSVKLKPYTLKTCIVSGDKLGEMGDAYVYAYKGCLKDFNKEPAKYIKLIDEAEAKAKKAKS